MFFELLLVPEDRLLIREVFADVIKGETREYEVRWRKKDGTIIHFDGATVPRLSVSGEFLSTLCTLRDATERKSSEEKLRKSEEKYRDLIEISPDAIYVVDANGICVLGNRAGAELAGIPQDELIGTPVTDTYLPEERHLFLERLKKLEANSTLRFEKKVRTQKWRKRSRGGLPLRNARRIFSGDPARHQRTQASGRSAAARAPELRDTGEFA